MISDKVQFIYFFNLQKKNNQKNPKKQQHKKNKNKIEIQNVLFALTQELNKIRKYLHICINEYSDSRSV